MSLKSRQLTDAYLDIETTGLSQSFDTITVIGLLLCSARDSKLIQLFGRQVTKDNLLNSLNGVKNLYTYNGQRFDIPFIAARLGTDLSTLFEHRDLMYDCRRNNLVGGFKAVEQQLGIPRHLKGVGGAEAVTLWKCYKENSDREALQILLQYNKEDVVNLKFLKEHLEKWGVYPDIQVAREMSC
ncbi:MAG TPA: exonuclease [Dehalococcoidia bacterium]|nr:exonuclease [Dehalococcoidia bacterium]